MSAPPDPLAQDPWLDEAPKRRRRIPMWAIVVSAGCASMVLLIVLLVSVPVIALRAMRASIRTAPGSEIPDEELAWLRGGGFIEADEVILYFASRGTRKREERSPNYTRSFLTDRRVIDCSPGPSDVKVERASYDDILVVGTRSIGEPVSSIEIDIETVGGRELCLDVPAGDGHEREFERVLRERWRASRARAIDGLRADGSMSLERQVEILRRFGIEPASDVSVDSLVGAYPREEYEAPPFELLLTRLGELERDAAPGLADAGDVVLLEFGRIQQPGDLTRFAEHVRDLADGELPLEAMSDEVDRGRHHAVLNFEYQAKLDRWNVRLDGDRVDRMFLRHFVDLLDARECGRSLATARVRDGRTELLVCIEDGALRDLRHQTGIDFEWIE